MVWIIAIALVAGLAIGAIAYLAWYLRWEAEQTGGMAYYGRPVSERRRLKQQIQRYSFPVKPIVRLLASANRQGIMPAFEYEGVYGPTKVSSAAVFERAKRYQPRKEDVFVVTQMRCGTTWMQQLVYQIVTRGQGEFDDPRRSHLYAISPWIDAVNSVSMEDAPLVGERPTRIIKSHLPTALCPYSLDARYIYVTRHPVSCFASIVDYNRSLLGPLMPPVATLADWFCSDRMYWLPWPRHVDGWWQWAARRENVLFVHFEEMKKDFAGVRERIERFLGIELTPRERERVDQRCSFQYMKDHEEFFEMAPPTMFSAEGGEFLASGSESRKDDVRPAVRTHIVEYCRRELSSRDYPVARFYPDLADR
ncbi:MAG TPA: sulfotransferase domain-containing protein [Vicinamibacterales bacterium]|nr:sulfotransferase domain-containing protein [Vicinamibacterales bacterium]